MELQRINTEFKGTILSTMGVNNEQNGLPWLRESRTNAGLSQKELAKLVGVDITSINAYENGRSTPRIGTSKKIKQVIANYTETNKVAEPQIPYQTAPNSPYQIIHVPMIPIKARASYVTDHQDATFIQELTHIPFIVEKNGQGNYYAFEISGDSMECESERSIPEASIVLSRELKRDLWRSKLHTHKYPYWIIVTKNDILCKEIVDQDLETGVITCHSLNQTNPQYQDFELHLDDIQQLCNIVKIQKDPI